MRRLAHPCALFLVLFLCGCAGSASSSAVVPVDPARYGDDATITALLAPYSAQVEQLRIPISFAPSRMEGRRANGELACWMADVTRNAAEQALGEPIDAAFVNAGGIRDILREGTVTEESMLTIMPFENRIVIFTLSGGELRELVTVIARRRGFFPVSGLSIHMDADGKLIDFAVNGKPPQDDASYRIATSDYLAGGGDRMTVLATFDPPVDARTTIRDAMIAHAREAQASGTGVVAPSNLSRYQREESTDQ